MTSEVGKHTPGPWKARIQRAKDGRDLGWIIEHQNGRIGWASLAYADTNTGADASDPAREANAHLMAAAPALLEALEGMLEEFNEQTITGIVHDELAKIAKARQALALARGEGE